MHMDLNSAVNMLATKHIDPNFSEKVSNHIDNYGTIDVDEGKVVNGRYYRLFLINQIVTQTHADWGIYADTRNFIREIAMKMIKLEVHSELSYKKNDDEVSDMHILADAISYAIGVIDLTPNATDSKPKQVGRVKTLLNYFREEESVPADLYLVGNDGVVRSL